MLRQDLNSTSNHNGAHSAAEGAAGANEATTGHHETVKRLDIQQSLNVLEELILESPRVPFSGRTLVDEDQLLEQLDRIRLNLPTVFQEAIQIVQQHDRIIHQANQYAQEMMEAAEQEAARRVDDLGIVQQAESQARQVKQQLEQDCDALRSQTRSEIEQWQNAAEQYWEETRRTTEDECLNLRQDADAYAADVLHSLEQKLSDMMRIVRNGRSALPPGSGTVETTARTQEATSAKNQGTALPTSADANRTGRSRRNLPPS
jgi:molecular chaperone DnaK (HSP70)